MSRSPQDAGRWFEKEFADAVKGKTVVASGNTPYHKGDVITQYHLFDCKHTESDSIIIRLSDIIQIQKWGQNVNRQGALAIGFGSKKFVLLPAGYIPNIEEQLNV